MKQRRKAILALLLSASVAASPIVSATSVFPEDLDFATVEETEVTSEDAGSDFSDDSISIEDSDDVTEADTADDSILIDNSDSAEYSESDFFIHVSYHPFGCGRFDEYCIQNLY